MKSFSNPSNKGTRWGGLEVFIKGQAQYIQFSPSSILWRGNWQHDQLNMTLFAVCQVLFYCNNRWMSIRQWNTFHTERKTDSLTDVQTQCLRMEATNSCDMVTTCHCSNMIWLVGYMSVCKISWQLLLWQHDHEDIELKLNSLEAVSSTCTQSTFLGHRLWISRPIDTSLPIRRWKTWGQYQYTLQMV